MSANGYYNYNYTCAKVITSRGGIIYDYVDSLPDDAITVNKYCNHDIRDIYYSSHTRKFYYKNMERTVDSKLPGQVIKYRILHYSKDVQGSPYVSVKDVAGHYFRIYLLKFRDLYSVT